MEKKVRYTCTHAQSLNHAPFSAPPLDLVDMWSVGCIMAELLTGQVLFPGSDHIDQLTRILQIVGTPPQEFVMKITSDTVRWVWGSGWS